MKKDIPNYGVNEILQFVGINSLSIEGQVAVKDISTREFEKVKRQLKNIISMVVHVKVYSKEASKAKFALHIRVISPTQLFESCKSHDWDLVRALRKSFEDIHNEIEHKFKTNATREHVPHQKLGKRKRQGNLLNMRTV